MSSMEFYQLFMGNLNYEAARAYTAEYIQHDPLIGGGFDALAAVLQTFPQWKDREPPKIEFKLVAADGDLVYLQVHSETRQPEGGTLRRAVVHTFHFYDDGKIVEHWSVVGKADPAKTVSKHPLF